MTDRSVAIRQLLELLPDFAEFDSLRRALHRASSEDSSQQWASRSDYATVDRRLVPQSALSSIISSAEAEARARTRRLYAAAGIALSSTTGNGLEQKTQELVTLGESAEATEQWAEAAAYYLLANGLARQAANLQLRALAARRVARAALNTGDFARATEFYSTSLAMAATAGDVEGQLIASTGLGNVASYQGRWAESDIWYSNALTLCGKEFARERGQLLVNRSMATREQHRLDEASALLEQAREFWDMLKPADRAGWYNNFGLLQLAENRIDEAEAAFAQALESEPDQYHRAMVLDNMAEAALRRGAFDQAVARCREAESVAIEHGSPRALAEVYMRLGRIASRREDPNGVAFFEKALEIARDRHYPLLVGEICREYGSFRKKIGEREAARSLLERALRIFTEIGAATNAAEVRRELLPPEA